MVVLGVLMAQVVLLVFPVVVLRAVVAQTVLLLVLGMVSRGVEVADGVVTGGVAEWMVLILLLLVGEFVWGLWW